jgi:4-diphosphocytidyl-2-C-methyl-D-erythritol kinase
MSGDVPRRPCDPSASGLETRDAGVIRVRAPAKINLNLLVYPPGPDGYHPLDSYVVQVDFADVLEFAPRSDAEVQLEVTGDVNPGPAEENLVVKAARALLRLAKGDRGVTIRLDKRIPCGAGLGGGSSDAASTLLALRALWGLDLDPSQLAQLALQLGSDVPLFLENGPCRMRGRGEILEPVEVFPAAILLILTGQACPTGAVYGRYDRQPFEPREQLAQRLLCRPASQWRRHLVNDLAGAACEVSPGLGALWREVSSRCRVPVHLTGSGGTLFALADEKEQLADLRQSLGDIEGIRTIPARIVGV